MSMPVVISTQGIARSPVRDVRARAERMLEALGMTGAELSILLCDDATIHTLNRRYRKKDKPTDVLAFAMEDPKILGDVVISIETARRQAKTTLSGEVTLLLAHGLLHLLGYDHRTDAEERRMKARTDMLCAAANARPHGKRRRDRARGTKKPTKKRR